jgi:predicted anti-sigma-YlaC factor YlaD
MTCETCRDALSARLDGEDPGTPEALVDRHLAGCAACRAWSAQLTSAAGALRVTPAEPVPDLTAPILAAAAARRRAATPGPARVALLLVGLAQVVVALPSLLGDADGASVHVAREHGAWELALAIGLVVAAVRPARTTGGLVPVLAVLTTALLVSTGIDVASGHTTAMSEAGHLLPLTGLAMLVLLRRWTPTPDAAVPAA